MQFRETGKTELFIFRDDILNWDWHGKPIQSTNQWIEQVRFRSIVGDEIRNAEIIYPIVTEQAA